MKITNARSTRWLAGLAAATVLGLAVAPIAHAAVINGTPDDDDITGTATADTVWAKGGNDVVHGAGGNDVLHGGPGADTMAGDAGWDILRGDSGVDTLNGNAGADRIYTFRADVAHGGADVDQIRVGNGDARGYGDAGGDWLIALGIGDAVLYGGSGNDQLWVESNGFGKVLYGGADDDSLYTQTDGATMDGGIGDDGLVMRFAGVLVGGDGDDILVGDSAEYPSKTVLSCGAGIDRVSADLADEIGADCEDVTVNIQTGEGDDTVVGTAYNDSISSGDGNDQVQGLGGNDGITLWGGQDSVDAGDGDDTVYADFGSRFWIVGDIDHVTCGDGYDIANVDDVDTVAADCEEVYVAFAPKG